MIQLSATGRYLEHKLLIAQMRLSLRFKKRLAFSLLYRTDVRWKRFQENNISIGDRPDGMIM
jgi:hypothetical protein